MIFFFQKKIFVIGSSNEHGELGTGNELPGNNRYMPLKSVENIKFIGVSAGVYHSIAISDSQELYVWFVFALRSNLQMYSHHFYFLLGEETMKDKLHLLGLTH